MKISPFYNFSSPDYFSVIEIYKLLCNLVTGDFVEPKYEINSEYEIQDQKLDARKIKNDLGIEASVSISEGLSKNLHLVQGECSILWIKLPLHLCFLK